MSALTELIKVGEAMGLLLSGTSSLQSKILKEKKDSVNEEMNSVSESTKKDNVSRK